MKTLLLMRHAKSSWDDPTSSDYDRPLNKRGRSDAPAMGRLLVEHRLTPDRIVASSARRAAETAADVASACGYQGPLDLTKRLYLAPPEVYLEILREQDDACGSVMLVGHNPGISELAARFGAADGELPTAAIVQLRLDIHHWADAPGAASLVASWAPGD